VIAVARDDQLTGLSYSHRCSICEGNFEGWGHNAAPFPGRCCEECNIEAVLPIRRAMAVATDERRASRERAA
jgi:hypothetical protein